MIYNGQTILLTVYDAKALIAITTGFHRQAYNADNSASYNR